MEEQREKGRKAWGGSGDEKASQVLMDLGNQLGATSFTGFDGDTGQD